MRTSGAVSRSCASTAAAISLYESEEFVGIVSLRDMVALMLEEKERLIQELTRYIAGAPGG